MKKIKRIKPISLGKILGIMYVLMGLIIGGFITLFAVLGSAFFSPQKNLAGILFGVGAIIFLPIFYGVMGFISGVVSGWFFNLAAKWIGGLEIELQEEEVVKS